MNYKSINDLSLDLMKGLSKIPHDIDLIVGIPRSGMLVANMIALLLNRPLTDIDSFLADRIYSVGMTKRRLKTIQSIYDCKKVLIVEDTVNSGTSITLNRRRIENANYPFECIYFAAYVAPGKETSVDIFLEIVSNPRLFEWNIFHHPILEKTCIDIDGVLCDDPTDSENDDGVEYSSFLNNAPPKLIPSRLVKYVVSSRLEKYRPETEEWLRKQNVEYQKLFLLNSTAEERRANSLHAKFKAEIYMKSDCILFIESNIDQALFISDNTKKPVFCVENNTLYDGSVKYRLQYEIYPERYNAVRQFFAKSRILRFSYRKIKQFFMK